MRQYCKPDPGAGQRATAGVVYPARDRGIEKAAHDATVDRKLPARVDWSGAWNRAGIAAKPYSRVIYQHAEQPVVPGTGDGLAHPRLCCGSDGPYHVTVWSGPRTASHSYSTRESDAIRQSRSHGRARAVSL